MKKQLFAATLVTMATFQSSPAQNDAAPPAQKSGKPEIGAWGFDAKGMDAKSPPGANFYKFANGGWLAATKIPDDKSNYGMFTVLNDKSDERTKEIILGAYGEAGSEIQKIVDYYASFMDEAAIEAKGVAPIQGELAKIAAIGDAGGLVAAFAANARQFRTGPFMTVVAQDDRAPELYIANIGQSGLGLPDRDMYDAGAKQFAAARDGYRKYIATMLTLAGAKDADARAAAVYALEEKIAATHWTRVENRDPQKTYNKLTIAELQKTAPGIDWKTWLAAVGLEGQPAVNVNQPTAVAGTIALVASVPLATWKDYLTIHLLTDAAPYLSKAFVDAHFEMYGRTLSGTPQIEQRWKRGVDHVIGAMGEAVGKIYVARYFTPETKAAADRLVHNLLVSMGQRLDALTWMSAETKAKAKAKLATYNPKIGYPKKWRDYSALKIVAGDPVGNATRAAAFEYDRQLAKLSKPINRDE